MLKPETLDALLDSLPVIFDWAEVDGETCFVGIDVAKTERCHRPVFDLFHCATEALNGNAFRSTYFHPDRFHAPTPLYQSTFGYTSGPERPSQFARAYLSELE